MTTTKKKATKVDIDRTIETEFKDIRLEQEVIAFLLRKGPIYSHIFTIEWFTIQPFSDILKVLQKVKVTFTKRSILTELKHQQLLKKEDQDIYEQFIDKIYKTKIVHINSRNIEVLARQLFTLYESRQCIIGIKDILINIKRFDLDKTKEKLKNLSQLSNIEDLSKNGEYVEDLENRVDVIKERRLRAQTEDQSIGIPTGIRKIDNQIGGLLKEEFVVLLGRPAIGKTAMMLDMSIHPWLMENKNVLFATGEMSKRALEFRMDSNICGISTNKFRLGEISNAEIRSWRNKVKSIRDMQDSFYEIISFPRNFNLNMIEDRMERVQEKHGKEIDILVLDYLNIALPNSNRAKGEWASQSDVVWDFKALCADFNKGIAGITAGQIKDDFFTASRLDLSAAKYSRAISETAPIVFGLVRTDDDILDNTLQIQVLKMRNAPMLPRPIILRPNLDCMRMDQVQHIKRKNLIDLDIDLLKDRQTNKKGGAKK